MLLEGEYNAEELSSSKKGSQDYFYDDLKDDVDVKSLDNLAMSNLEIITRGCNVNKNNDDRFRWETWYFDVTKNIFIAYNNDQCLCKNTASL